jgi:hypothetical protein
LRLKGTPNGDLMSKRISVAERSGLRRDRGCDFSSGDLYYIIKINLRLLAIKLPRGDKG